MSSSTTILDLFADGLSTFPQSWNCGTPRLAKGIRCRRGVQIVSLLASMVALMWKTYQAVENSFTARFQLDVVAVVKGELDFDAAAVFEFG